MTKTIADIQDAIDLLVDNTSRQITPAMVRSALSDVLTLLSVMAPQEAVDNLLGGIQASLPVAASAAPPGVGVSSAKGSSTDAYALADHTHASSVQRQKITLTGAGTATWTFATPYAVPPIVTATVENTGTQPYVVNLAGPATKTGVTFNVFKAQATTLGGSLGVLLGAIISPFAQSPAGVTLNCWAALPTS